MNRPGSTSIYLWRIRSCHWWGEEGKIIEEFVAAPTIEHVWEYLALDRMDEGVEIEAVVREVPILCVLPKPEKQL